MEHDNSSLVELLPEFFHQWPKNLEWAREKDKKTNIEASQLTEFFSLLSEPLKVVQHRSLSFDPWEVAGLGRKEVRNTAVLSWLLDPEEPMVSVDYLYRLSCGQYDTAGMISLKIIFTTAGYKLKRILLAKIAIVLI